MWNFGKRLLHLRINKSMFRKYDKHIVVLY